MKEKTLLFWSRNRWEVILFSTAFFLRVFVFLILLFLIAQYGILSPDSRHIYPIIGVDSGGYVATARVLLTEGRFAFPGVAEPQSYQMPVYPFFLAGILALFGSIPPAIILQAIVSGFSAILIFKIGGMISWRVGMGAALLFAIDPIGIFYATTILTETLFIFFVLLAIFLYLRYSGDVWRGLFLSSVVVGVATLTRPSAIVIPPILVVTSFFFSERTTRRVVISMCAIVAGFFIVVFPWMFRNYYYFDSWALTAVATTQWFQQSAPLYYAYKHNISHAEAYEMFRSRLIEINPYKSDAGTLRNTPYMSKVVREFLLEDPLGYAYFHAVKTLPFFFSDGLRDIARRLDFIEAFQPNIGNLLLAGDYKNAFNALTRNGFSSALLLIGGGVWFCITACMAASVGGLLRTSKRAHATRVIMICLLVVFATALIAGGPNASARYRFSVSPFIFIAAVYGLEFCIKKYRYFYASSER